MIRTRLSVILALGILLTGTLSTQVSASPTPKASRFMVTFHDGVDAQAMGTAMAGLGMNVVRVYATLLSGVAVDLTPDQVSTLSADPNVALIEADVPVRGDSTQTGGSWVLDRLDARELTMNGSYTYPSSAGSGVVVYVVDSGINNGQSLAFMPHPELYGRIAPGASWVQDNNDSNECFGHGTPVAGIIAGTEFGVAKLATVVSARVLDCAGNGSMSNVVAALDWIAATHNRAKPAVVNMSLSGPASQTMDNAVTRLFDSGVTVVASAGNSNASACNVSPARAAAAITVGSTHTTDYRASDSNHGPCLDLFATGTMVETASGNSASGITTFGGTSASAAIVSGIAALILADNPGFTAAQVRDRILGNATPGIVMNPGEGSPNLLAHVPH